MKKTILFLMLCFLSHLGVQAGDYQYLVFTTSDNTTTAVTAANLTISFSGDNLVAASGPETLATLPLANLVSMTFSNETTAVERISAHQIVTDEATVIYDMNGRQMPKNASLPKGVYIVKNSNRTIKMQVK